MIYERSKWFRMELDRAGVGKRIAKARRRRRWTQPDLAEVLGVCRATISGWERGLHLPATRDLGTLANCLRTSLDKLLLDRGRNARHWK